MKYLFGLISLSLLVGCQFNGTASDIGKTLEVGQRIQQNDALINAGEEVLTGGKEIIATGKEAAGSIGAGAQKVLSGGKVILDETQEILNELQAQESVQPEATDTVWLRQEDQGCADGGICFSWRPDEESPWRLLQGSIENLEDLPGQIDNWQVQINAITETLESWQVGEVLSTEGQ